MKVIQVPRDDKLLGEMNREAKASRSSRNAIIRRACEEEGLDRQYIERYRWKPEKTACSLKNSTVPYNSASRAQV